jgi:transposase-like protein
MKKRRRNGPRPREDDDKRTEVVRLHVLEGVPLPEAARQVGVPERTAREWVAKYGAGIIAALKSPKGTPTNAVEQARALRDIAFAQVLAANDAHRANDAKAYGILWAIASDKLKVAQAATGEQGDSLSEADRSFQELLESLSTRAMAVLSGILHLDDLACDGCKARIRDEPTLKGLVDRIDGLFGTGLHGHGPRCLCKRCIVTPEAIELRRAEERERFRRAPNEVKETP